MEICDRMFTRVREHLDTLEYHGPIAFSWDDSKLLASWQLTYCPIQKTDILIGCVDGLLRVADDGMVRAIMQDPKYVLGTKVLYIMICIQL